MGRIFYIYAKEIHSNIRCYKGNPYHKQNSPPFHINLIEDTSRPYSDSATIYDSLKDHIPPPHSILCRITICTAHFTHFFILNWGREILCLAGKFCSLSSFVSATQVRMGTNTDTKKLIPSDENDLYEQVTQDDKPSCVSVSFGLT